MKSFFSLVIVILIYSTPGLTALIYSPNTLIAENAKVIVAIHGCLQSAESMSLGTGWNQIADANNLVIIYPQVPANSNPLDCWNWYLPENQIPESGQLKIVRDEVQAVIKSLNLKSPEIFLSGISSGAATVAGLLSCFPNEFKAGALHSGPSYGLAQNITEGEQVLKLGPPKNFPKTKCLARNFLGSILVIQGTNDIVVNPKNSIQIISDFIGNKVEVTKNNVKDNKNIYSISDFVSTKGSKGRLILVNELGHAWSGFDTNLRNNNILGPKGKVPTIIPFFSDLGPSATNIMWDFFKEISQASKSSKNN